MSPVVKISDVSCLSCPLYPCCLSTSQCCICHSLVSTISTTPVKNRCLASLEYEANTKYCYKQIIIHNLQSPGLKEANLLWLFRDLWSDTMTMSLFNSMVDIQSYTGKFMQANINSLQSLRLSIVTIQRFTAGRVQDVKLIICSSIEMTDGQWEIIIKH